MNARLINILINHGEEAFRQKSFDTAMQYTNQAMELTHKLKQKYDLSKIFILKGKIQNSRGQYSQDLQLLDEAESYFIQAGKYSPAGANAEVLLNCGYVYLNRHSYELAYKYFNDALSIAESKNDLDTILQAMSGLSKVLIAENKFKDALEIAKQAFILLDDEVSEIALIDTYEQYLTANIKMAQFATVYQYGDKALKLSQKLNDVENEAKILNSIAIAHAVKGEYKEAFEKFMGSKAKSETIGFHANTAKCYINMGNILSALSNHKEAYDNYYSLYSTLYLFEALDEYTKGILLYNFGCLAYLFEKKDEAISYLEQARILGQETDNIRLIGHSLFELMRIYLRDDQIELALTLAKTASKFYDSLGDGIGTESHLANIAEINLVQKKYPEAIKYALKAVEVANNGQNHKTRQRCYKLLSDIYKSMNDYKNAYKYLDLFAESSVMLHKEMRKRVMLDLERKYETNKKEKEIELLKSKMEIQSLELDHAKQLSEKNEKVANAQEEIRQYTYAVSHDLKEPLRMIGSFSKLLQRKYQNTADATDLEFFDYIHNGVKRMSDLLNALLEYGRVGKHDENKEWVDLKELMEDIKATYYLTINEQKAKLIIGQMPMIYTNRLMIFQLLQNLVSNGLKFKKINILPIVTINYKELENAHLISVNDNGIGIANEYKERIFQIFARLHKKDEYEGTGIGLAMCKKIINHLNGRIEIESKLDIGHYLLYNIT